MKAISLGLAAAAALCAGAAHAGAQANAAATSPHLAGTWRGTSICTPVGKPACHDEVVVYHVRNLSPGAPSAAITATDGAEEIEIVMNKIVKAKEDSMGTVTCAHSADPRHITCPMRGWSWAFELRADTLIGTLASPTNAVWRNIRVVRAARSS